MAENRPLIPALPVSRLHVIAIGSRQGRWGIVTGLLSTLFVRARRTCPAQRRTLAVLVVIQLLAVLDAGEPCFYILKLRSVSDVLGARGQYAGNFLL